MTSDAKIGLLLGFVFILVIVSLVNGLPGLIGKDSADNGVNTSVPPLKTEYGINGNPNDVVDIIDDIDWSRFKTRRVDSKGDNRFTQGRIEPKKGTDDNKVSDDKKSDNKTPVDDKKYYVVKEGDNLGKIARKVYGNEIGNKQATVDMIFKANSHILRSPDDLSIDQKLIMPQLNGDSEDSVVKTETKSKKGKGIVGTVSDAAKNLFGSNKKSSTLHSTYIVKHEDNLWKIASTQLGDGSRIVEIKKLNESILKGSNKLSPGMELKIPQE